MTCSIDGSLGVWNLQTGQHIASWQDGESGIYTIALSADGKKVVSGGTDGVVRLWSIETGKVIARWTGHTDPVKSVCWNRDDERVLSGSWDGTARVWDVETGNTILEINTGLHVSHTATFSPASTLIATGGLSSVGESLKIWDANTGKLVAILKGQAGVVYCLAWTADGRTLISGCDDSTIRIWNTSTWQQLTVLTGHSRHSAVYDIAISPNGRILASASYDDTARLWSLENGQPIGSPLQHPYIVDGVSFSKCGTLLATGCRDKNAYTWDVSAIIQEAGSNELLDDKKSFLQADAMRRPVQQPKNVRTVPAGFFDETLPAQHPDSQPTTAHPIPPPSVPHDSDSPPELEVQPRSPESIKSRFFKWLHINTPARPTFLQRARLPFFKQPRRHDVEGTEMQERPGSIVDVPLAQGLSRHAAAGGYRMKENKNKNEEVNAEGEDKGNGNENKNEDKNENDEKEKQANIIENTKNAAITSRPHTHWSNITQPVAGPSRAKQSSGPQAAAASPNNAISPAAISLSAPLANTVILRPRCCIPFLSCLGCASQYPDGHH